MGAGEPIEDATESVRVMVNVWYKDGKSETYEVAMGTPVVGHEEGFTPEGLYNEIDDGFVNQSYITFPAHGLRGTITVAYLNPRHILSLTVSNA